MRVVAALGGNALLRRGERAEAEIQRRHVADAARSLAEIARDHELIVTHGNGPQVGLLALQSAAPFDVLGAETEGMIGYLLEQALRNELPNRQVAALLTQVLVDPDDPAFRVPTKPIGPVHEDGSRRVVASPEPKAILEIETLRTLVDLDVLVICAGGGGIPVVKNGAGRLHGVEAVIDKDLSSALLALELGADALLLLTDVDGIQLDYGTPVARRLREATPGKLAALDLPAGSMGPKAEAARRFVEHGGRFAAIASLEHAAAALEGQAGTTVRRSGPVRYNQSCVPAGRSPSRRRA